MEDSRHAVSDRVLQHYKSLKSGNPTTTSDEPDESGRKPLEGDWCLFSILRANPVQYVLKISRNRRWRIQYIVRQCVETTFIKNVSINGPEVNDKKEQK